MADQLATQADLEALLQTTLPAATATLILEAATAVVQAAAGQRLIAVVDDEIELPGTGDVWLQLPERPVTAVSSASIDGTALTFGADLRVSGSALWRRTGWAACSWEPSSITVVYSHGYAADDQALQLARSAVLGIARTAAANPSGATQVAIDDYRAAYESTAAAMEASPALRAALRKQYGRKGGLVRIG